MERKAHLEEKRRQTDPPHSDRHRAESGRQAQSPAQGPKEEETRAERTEIPKGRRESRREEGGGLGGGKRQEGGQRPIEGRRDQRGGARDPEKREGQGPRQRGEGYRERGTETQGERGRRKLFPITL